MYVYGTLNFGFLSRSVFARPLIIESKESVNGSAAASSGKEIDGEKKKLDVSFEQDKNFNNTSNSSSNGRKDKKDRKEKEKEARISLRICVIPGLENVLQFKECLRSKTFSLQVRHSSLLLK